MNTPTNTKETIKRTLVKTISYRIFIMTLDFICVYLLTGKTSMAVGFMIISNIYTSAGYFAFERIWDRIKWGREINQE